MSEVTYARGNGSFGPEDIAQLVAGLELALTNLDIKDRNDPTVNAQLRVRRNAPAMAPAAQMLTSPRRAFRRAIS